jgi:hypothetical protein
LLLLLLLLPLCCCHRQRLNALCQSQRGQVRLRQPAQPAAAAAAAALGLCQCWWTAAGQVFLLGLVPVLQRPLALLCLEQLLLPCPLLVSVLLQCPRELM